jgi:hemoglobin
MVTERREAGETMKIKRTNQGGKLTLLAVAPFLAAAFLVVLLGCHSDKAEKPSNNFFTSGSREADQRASQKMAQSEQMAGTGEGAGEKGVKKAKTSKTEKGDPSAGSTNKPAQVVGKLALFDRLGGSAGISNIVADFTARVIDDPRVNWGRTGVKRGGLSFHRGQSVAWDASPENVAILKKHLVEFLALATGGPARYTGKQLEPVHAGMHISNPEFDAVIGDLKATLDKLQIPNLEQKELLATVESTRPEIVTQR